MPPTDSATWSLTGINVYPVKGEPGRSLKQAVLTDSGLVGDRAKKRALLVAPSEEASADLRANLLVDMTAEEFYALEGEELQVGEVTVRLTRRPEACEGLYAEPVRGGDVIVGDRVRVVRCCASF